MGAAAVVLLMGAVDVAVLAGDFSPYSARHSSGSESEEAGGRVMELPVTGVAVVVLLKGLVMVLMGAAAFI